MRKNRFSGLLLAATVAAAGAMPMGCNKDDAKGGTENTFTVGEGKNKVGFDMVAVQGGDLYVGYSETPLTEPKNVTISDFSIGKTEVTQGLWGAVMGKSQRDIIDEVGYDDHEYGIGSNYPVYYVSWEDIVGTSGGGVGYTERGVEYYKNGFCYKLSQKVGSGKKFRLPTEAEWEYAARGGQKSKGYEYSGSDSVKDVAWCCDNAGATSHAVGTKAANELGICDMSGNVDEWCGDLYDWSNDTYPSGHKDPTGATSGARVIRGGSWSYYTLYCRVSSRNNAPGSREDLGFRLVLSGQ